MYETKGQMLLSDNNTYITLKLDPVQQYEASCDPKRMEGERNQLKT